jgi:hypothetical protein
MRQKKARKSARSLHNAIIRGKCWKCPCKEKHLVHFVFDPPYVEAQNCKDSRFRLVFASTPTLDLPEIANYGHEIEAKPGLIHLSTEPQTRNACQDLPIHQPVFEKKTKLQFSHPESEKQSILIPDQWQASLISDICFTLSTAPANSRQSQLLGCLSDDTYRHDMYYVRSYAENLKSQSLAELITASSNPRATAKDRFIFPQRHRLRLAVNLACSVLQFHGSWLKSQWRARDIMFAAKTSADVESPYIIWNMIDGDGHVEQKAALIRNEILFPLGLVLVELSLCQTLESLRTPEDSDQVEAHMDLKTATRHLSIVEMESGEEYSKVVERCLFWSGVKGSTLDNEQMQDEVFQVIILPLIENLKNFEGKSYFC